MTDPKRQEIQTDYDRAGRVDVVRLYNAQGNLEETRTSDYDKAGNLLSRTDKHGISTYTYDAAGRLHTESRHTTTGGIADNYTITSDYDPAGNRTRVIFPGTGRTLVSHYDPAGRLVQLDDGAISGVTFVPMLTSTFGYDSAGNRTRYTSPFGVVTMATFDDLNRVQSLTTRGEDGMAASALYDVTYSYDLAGNRRTAVESIDTLGTRNITWNYDGLYRLTDETWTGDATMHPQLRTYTYDPAGNRVSSTVDTLPGAAGGDTSTTFVYDDRNRLLTSSDGTNLTSFAHDANGNRSGRIVGGNTTTYTFDVSNRLTEAKLNGGTIFTAHYDARTRRIGKIEGTTTTTYRYDAGTNFQELQDGEVLTELIRAGGLGGGIGSILYSDKTVGPTPGPWEGFVYNAVGSTVVVADSGGSARQRTEYEAFGSIITQLGASTNNRLRNTKERDASIGLDNDGFRYYDPETGRYLQRDPIGYGDGLNVYHHVTNNPINHVDPQGLQSALGSFFQEAWQQTKKVAAAAAAVPAGMKEGLHNTAKTIVLNGGNLLGLVSDETADESPLTEYLVGHVESGTTPIVQEAKDVGSGLASGNPDTYRGVGINALTAAAGIKVGGSLGRSARAPLSGGGGAAASVDGAEAASGGSRSAGVAQEGCFVAGTLVLAGYGEFIPIESVLVGQRVTTDGGIANSSDGQLAEHPNTTAVRKGWKKLTIDAPRVLPDGTHDVWQVQTLQSPAWLAEHHVKTGSALPLDELLDLKEMGLPDGLIGRVKKVTAAPAIADGPGQVVLTTVNHLNDFVFNLTLRDASGDLDTLSVTGWHKFFSEDRHTWVSTSELRHGEHLRGQRNAIQVATLTKLTRIHTVYNFTVEEDHVYYVGDLTTLTHNVNCWETGPANVMKANSVGDGLDVHHAPQAHPASQVIPGYDPATAPSVAIPDTIHGEIPRLRGPYHGTPRELLAQTARDLRNAGAPNSAVRRNLADNRAAYPGAYDK